MFFRNRNRERITPNSTLTPDEGKAEKSSRVVAQADEQNIEANNAVKNESDFYPFRGMHLSGASIWWLINSIKDESPRN